MKSKDQQLLEEAYNEVLLEGVGIMPYIPLIVDTLNKSSQGGHGSSRVVGEGDIYAVLVMAFVTVLASVIAGGFLLKDESVKGHLTRLKHWFLSFFSGKIDVQEVEKAAAKAKELLSGSKKGAVTLWTNRLKLAAAHKDRAGIHEAFTHLKKFIE